MFLNLCCNIGPNGLLNVWEENHGRQHVSRSPAGPTERTRTRSDASVREPSHAPVNAARASPSYSRHTAYSRELQTPLFASRARLCNICPRTHYAHAPSLAYVYVTAPYPDDVHSEDQRDLGRHREGSIVTRPCPRVGLKNPQIHSSTVAVRQLGLNPLTHR